MCTVLLSRGVNAVAVNKYIISYIQHTLFILQHTLSTYSISAHFFDCIILTPRSRSLLEKSAVSQVEKKCMHLMKPENSSSCSQDSANSTYPEPRNQVHVDIRVLTLRLLMSYIYIWSTYS